jgi:hypothetical protein
VWGSCGVRDVSLLYCYFFFLFCVRPSLSVFGDLTEPSEISQMQRLDRSGAARGAPTMIFFFFLLFFFFGFFPLCYFTDLSYPGKDAIQSWESWVRERTELYGRWGASRARQNGFLSFFYYFLCYRL